MPGPEGWQFAHAGCVLESAGERTCWKYRRLGQPLQSLSSLEATAAEALKREDMVSDLRDLSFYWEIPEAALYMPM